MAENVDQDQTVNNVAWSVIYTFRRNFFSKGHEIAILFEAYLCIRNNFNSLLTQCSCVKYLLISGFSLNF